MLAASSHSQILTQVSVAKLLSLKFWQIKVLGVTMKRLLTGKVEYKPMVLWRKAKSQVAMKGKLNVFDHLKGKLKLGEFDRFS